MSSAAISAPDLGVLNNFVNTFLNTINTGYASIGPEVKFITAAFITIDIVIMASFIALDEDGMAGFIRKFVRKIIEFGFVIFFITNWQYLTDAVGFSLGKLGLIAAGSTQDVTSFLEDPITIVIDGFKLVSSLMSTASNIPIGITTLNHLPEVLGYALSAFIIMIGYIVIAAEVFITFIEFKIICFSGLIFVPFSLIKPLAHLSHGALNAAFKFGAKFLVMAIVVTVGMNYVTQFVVNSAPDLGNLVAIETFSIVLFLLAVKLPNLASSQISGSPNLSGGGALGAVAGAVGGAVMQAMKHDLPPNGGGGGKGGGAPGTNSGLDQYRRAASAGVGDNANATTLAQMAKAANAMGGQNDQKTSTSGQG